MKSLLLLTIALALTPTVYASEEIDRDKYYYYCLGGDYLIQCLPNLKKGDNLNVLHPYQAALYCDPEKPIIRAGVIDYKTAEQDQYSCIYNGRKIKGLKTLNKL